MKEFLFKKIDAFATAKSSGNPAGFIWLESENSATKEEMQRIARELKGFVSEVGYAYPVKGTFRLQYYSSEREVEFCGHATIAIMYDIIKNTPHLIDKPEVNIITNKGELIVENQIRKSDAVFIMSPSSEFKKCDIPEEEIAEALNLDRNQIDDRYSMSIVNAGLQTLIVPINSLHSILSMNPDLLSAKRFCVQNKIDIIEVFCDDVYNQENRYRTRVFAPTFGYLEDPATGSGNAAFGYYLLNNGLWDAEPLFIEQNGFPGNYNLVQLKTRADANGNPRVLFGGGAITRIEGKYLLP